MATLSDKAMQAKPGTVDTWLIETGVRGEGRFIGRITPAGARCFYYRYTGSTGARVRLTIGPYDPRGDGRSGFTVQQARDKARELSALYRAGVHDLREHFEREEADRQRAKEAALREAEAAERAAADAAAALARRLTVRQLFERWATTDLQPRTRADGQRTGRKDGGKYVREQFERHVFPLIGSLFAADVRKADLLAVLDAQTADGKMRTANVLLADMKQMFDFAADRDLTAGNPLSTVKKSKIGGPSVERSRALSDDELQALAHALPGARMAARSMAAVWLILATGVRAGECFGATWASPGLNTAALTKTADQAGAKFGTIDLAARTWHLPDTKNQRDHTIHLSDFALARLAELSGLRELGDDGKPAPWVFPATDRRRPVCIKSFGKQLADRQREPDARMSGRSKATQSLALPGGPWTAHDLRRTAATLMARLGVSTDVIDECLNHKLQSKVARVYIHDRREAEQRRAFDALGQRLAELRDGAAAADNVVALRRA